MSNLETTPDLIEDALRKSGEKTDGTSLYAGDALEYMNAFYLAILSGGDEFEVELAEPWTWAKAKYPGVLTLVAPFETGTVAMTQGSASGTFSSAPSDSQLGRYLHVNDTFEYYRVTAHTAGATAFTIDGPYNADTTLATAFKCHKLDYDLDAADLLRLTGPFKVYRPQTIDADFEGEMVGLDVRSFSKKWPLYKLFTGTPTEFCIVSEAEGVITVRMNKSVTVPTRVEYDYIPTPDPLTTLTNSLPLIPRSHRQVLAYATAHAILTDKEDNKATNFFNLTKLKLQSLKGANRKQFMQISKNRGRLIPRLDNFGVRIWPTSGT